MPINFNNVIDIMLGQNQVTQIEDSLGNVLWSATPPAPTAEYFYMENISNDTATVSFNAGNDTTINIKVSTDMSNWVDLGLITNAPTYSLPAGDKLYISATGDTWNFASIKCNKSFNIGGYLMSLLKGDNFLANNYFNNEQSTQFGGIFGDNTTLISANNLIMATNTGYHCYQWMFAGCTALTATPVLPATTLSEGCYSYMFYGCTSLTTAPALPATTLVSMCYLGMFSGCTNLNSVTTYATDISANVCIDNWLSGVSSTGDFYNMACTTYPEGASGIPAGWTELHTLNDTINVTIHNVDLSVSGATYQIDSGTEQPITETGDGITEFTIPVTATDLTINGSRMTIEATGICGYTSGRTMSVSKMSDNVDIDITSMM